MEQSLDARPTEEQSGRAESLLPDHLATPGFPADKQAALYAALARAQGQMETPKFDSVNPHFKSKFASLVATIKATKPALNKEGLALTQFPVRGTDGMPMLRTILTHANGGMLSEDMPLLPGKNDMQGLGAAITYARRFSWSAVCGIASEEDDDGNSTVPAATGASRSASQPKTDPVATPAPPKAENGSQDFSTPAPQKDIDAHLEAVVAAGFDREAARQALVKDSSGEPILLAVLIRHRRELDDAILKMAEVVS